MRTFSDVLSEYARQFGDADLSGVGKVAGEWDGNPWRGRILREMRKRHPEWRVPRYTLRRI